MARFIANETFTDEDTGTEYFQGAIYDVTPETKAKIEQWTAEDKVRDPDVSAADDVEKTIDEAKAGHEDEEDGADEQDENDDDDDDEPKDQPA